MKNRSLSLGLLAACACFLFIAGVAANDSNHAKITFTKDVAPIFYNRCVECHRPGEVAPMSLIAYSDARPWAKSVKQKVLDRSMPPWLASAENTHFKNDRRLSQKEIDTITAWVDGGAIKGNDEDLPTPTGLRGGDLAAFRQRNAVRICFCASLEHRRRPFAAKGCYDDGSSALLLAKTQ